MKQLVAFLDISLLLICFFCLTAWVLLMSFFFGIGLFVSFIRNYFKKSIYLHITSTK